MRTQPSLQVHFSEEINSEHLLFQCATCTESKAKAVVTYTGDTRVPTLPSIQGKEGVSGYHPGVEPQGIHELGGECGWHRSSSRTDSGVHCWAVELAQGALAP